MNYTVVVDPDNRMRHIVLWRLFMDGSGPAACGRRVWPGQWTETKTTELPLCVGCVNAARNVLR